MSAGTTPYAIAADPTGRFVFVANSGGSNTVQSYTINQSTGALTSVGTITTGTNPSGMTVDSTGRFVFALISGSIIVYAINQFDGTLTSRGAFAVGGSCNNIATDPTSRFIFAAIFNNSIVQSFAINMFSAMGTLFSQVTSITAATTLDSTHGVVLCGGTTSYQVTLPTAVGITGRQYQIKKNSTSAYTLTIGTTSSQTIDGVTSLVLTTQYNNIVVISDGANWSLL